MEVNLPWLVLFYTYLQRGHCRISPELVRFKPVAELDTLSRDDDSGLLLSILLFTTLSFLVGALCASMLSRRRKKLPIVELRRSVAESTVSRFGLGFRLDTLTECLLLLSSSSVVLPICGTRDCVLLGRIELLLDLKN